MRKKEKIVEEKKHSELKTYTLNGINVTVFIDFDRDRISLMESIPKNSIQHVQPKKWIFAERGIEYMQGWQNILDAMKYAIEMASGELNVELERRELQSSLEEF